MTKVHTGQEGMALVLVLIVFGVGSLTIVPFLDYARSSLQDPGASSSSGSDGPRDSEAAAVGRPKGAPHWGAAVRAPYPGGTGYALAWTRSNAPFLSSRKFRRS